MLEHLHTNSKADRFELSYGDAKKELAWTAAPIHCDICAVLKGARLPRTSKPIPGVVNQTLIRNSYERTHAYADTNTHTCTYMHTPKLASAR